MSMLCKLVLIELRFLPILAFMLVGSQCEAPQKAPAKTNQTNVSNTKTLTGFNAEYMTDVCIDADVTDKLENVRLHKDCKDIVDVLNPQIIRWPGGITAQYYHFNGNGYGFRSDEVKGTEYAGNAERLQDFLDVNFIELFMSMAKGRKVIYVANLLTGTLEENLQAINYLKQGGADVIGVELGNEFYFSKMTPADYLKRAQPYIDAIQDIKLAVHMAPDFGKKNQNWNMSVSKADVEAFVIHEYNRKVKNDCKQFSGDAFYECAIQKTNEFAGNYIQSLIRNYKRKYGNKEIWLTEWNLAPRTPGDVYGTYLHAYHTFKMMNRIQELDLEIALFHNLITGGNMYPVVSRRKEKLVYNPDFFVHTMMPKGKYEGSTVLAGCEVWKYSDGLAIANPSGNPVVLAKDQMPNSDLINLSTMHLLKSNALQERPEYSKMKLEGWEIPPYSLVVLQ
ncbi:MAG: hypothetical protein GY751_17100 [Bacteroidetes bacterium]|nr:hypothetical protein [Bacteroidota bacterium]